MSKHSGAINKIDDRITELEAQAEQIEWEPDLSLFADGELLELERLLQEGAAEETIWAFLGPIEAEGRYKMIKKRRDL